MSERNVTAIRDLHASDAPRSTVLESPAALATRVGVVIGFKSPSGVIAEMSWGGASSRPASIGPPLVSTAISALGMQTDREAMLTAQVDDWNVRASAVSAITAPSEKSGMERRANYGGGGSGIRWRSVIQRRHASPGFSNGGRGENAETSRLAYRTERHGDAGDGCFAVGATLAHL
jgi:hypothetical protein